MHRLEIAVTIGGIKQCYKFGKFLFGVRSIIGVLTISTTWIRIFRVQYFGQENE